MPTTIGWDVSTSITGIAAIDAGTRRLLWKEHVDLRETDHLHDKLRAVRDHVRAWKLLSDPNHDGALASHFIEDRLGGFSKGLTSQQTLMKLSAFNAMVAWIVEDELGVRPTPVHPSTAKSLLKELGLVIPKSKDMPKGEDKKTLTLAWTRRREPLFSVELNRNDNVQPWAYDEADAYCVALVGTLRPWAT